MTEKEKEFRKEFQIFIEKHNIEIMVENEKLEHSMDKIIVYLQCGEKIIIGNYISKKNAR